MLYSVHTLSALLETLTFQSPTHPPQRALQHCIIARKHTGPCRTHTPQRLSLHSFTRRFKRLDRSVKLAPDAFSHSGAAAASGGGDKVCVTLSLRGGRRVNEREPECAARGGQRGGADAVAHCGQVLA